MRIVSFRTPKPKSFKYSPRYYDPKKEELEKKKAAMGFDNSLSHNEEFRLRMSKRWTRGNIVDEKPILSRIVTYLIYATFIGGSIYFILFTDIIEKMLSAFGVTN
ncbi:MAG: hypothetical protein H8E34_08050 [Bacteroidetes bacterium]|nr:hypothetical protein [Bacteroidota bacterium]MBL6943662.1 hypothetical protein [Bacteroidales bacterium]